MLSGGTRWHRGFQSSEPRVVGSNPSRRIPESSPSANNLPTPSASGRGVSAPSGRGEQCEDCDIGWRSGFRNQGRVQVWYLSIFDNCRGARNLYGIVVSNNVGEGFSLRQVILPQYNYPHWSPSRASKL